MPIPCEPGTYSDGPGRSTPCDPCPIGRFAPQAGSASLDECRVCDANLTTLRAGASRRASCVTRAYVCPAGTIALRNPPLSLDDCQDIECPAGMRLSADQASCEGESARCTIILRTANATVLQAAHPGPSSACAVFCFPAGCPPGFAGVPPQCRMCDEDAGELCPGLTSEPLLAPDALVALLANLTNIFPSPKSAAVAAEAARHLKQSLSAEGCTTIAATRRWYAAAVDSEQLTPAQQAMLAEPVPFSSGMVAIAATCGIASLVTVLAGCAALRAARPPVLLAVRPSDGASTTEVSEAAEQEIERNGCRGWAAHIFREVDQFDTDHP